MTEKSMIQIQWTGAAGLEFIYNDTTILIDPYFTRSGKKDVFLGRVRPDKSLIEKQVMRIGSISAVVVGHTHFDHALDIPEIAAHCSAPVFGNDSLQTLMGFYGLESRVHVCRAGETLEIGPEVRVTMLPSLHGLIMLGRVPFPGEIDPGLHLPLKVKDYRMGQVFSPKIQIKDTVFLHVGSAGFVEEALEGNRCDVLFLCIPGWNKMSGYPEKLIELTCPHTVVLFHHDNFFKPIKTNGPVQSLPFINIDGLISKIRRVAPSVNIVCPEMFEPMFF